MNKQPCWPLTLYYDGDCPLCAREIQLLRQRADVQRLCLVDIGLDDFHLESVGHSRETLQNRLHARFADGQWVTGLDATLWSWRAAGLERWAVPLTWPAFRPLLELGYQLFCRLRPHLDWLPHPDASRRCRNAACIVSKKPQ
ncbi:thiol-disulfide oxidoreductase DCC family protein [Pseudomonas sp. EA_35y_Pfl2_R111]|uniref:thiol-disulfide oxidoreductase DCC family protein n=1 Tax=Pseudomonas sp. EA_35y_Pfl2_R111 TaxID=3088689 RepID=UPI0030D6E958